MLGSRGLVQYERERRKHHQYEYVCHGPHRSRPTGKSRREPRHEGQCPRLGLLPKGRGREVTGQTVFRAASPACCVPKWPSSQNRPCPNRGAPTSPLREVGEAQPCGATASTRPRANPESETAQARGSRRRSPPLPPARSSPSASAPCQQTDRTPRNAGRQAPVAERSCWICVRSRRVPPAQYSRPASTSGLRPHANVFSYQPVIGVSVVPDRDEWTNQSFPT
jgi:hypothetical protein